MRLHSTTRRNAFKQSKGWQYSRGVANVTCLNRAITYQPFPLGEVNRAFNPIFEKWRKILKNKCTNLTPLQFLLLITLRKFKEKKCFPLRIQISAILFQIDCTINQYCKFLLFRVLLSTGLLVARWVLKNLNQWNNCCLNSWRLDVFLERFGDQEQAKCLESI